MYQNTIIFVTYDSVTNSVFTSQCLLLLNNLQKKFAVSKIIIVSFEKYFPSTQYIKSTIPSHYILHILPALPFLGRIFLSTSIHSFKKILNYYSQYTLIARGPLAGYIALKAFEHHTDNNLIIQARGLLTEEYAHTYINNNNIIKKPIYYFKKRLYHSLENYVYSSSVNWNTNIVIEAVSQALKNNLIAHYNAHTHKIFIAQYDIPNKIDISNQKKWRHEIRNKLNIAHSSFVLCYTGSAKSWQCPEDIIEYAESYLKQNSNACLLIFTQDREIFKKALINSIINCSQYKILYVPCTQMCRYLSACDAGLVFRKNHVVNWVSRPTKSLEYKAAGLKIIHNNTVAYLLEN